MQFRPRGNSMLPYITSGWLVTVDPTCDLLDEGDVVLARVRGKFYLHFVGAISTTEKTTRYRIENARGHVNGWVARSSVYGVVTSVVP